MTRRTLLLAGATAVTSIGLVAVAVVADPPLPQSTLLAAGAVLALLGVGSLGRLLTGQGAARFEGAPERPQHARTTGRDFDDLLDRAATLHRDGESFSRQRVRDRLHALGVAALTAYGGRSRSAALASIESGEWTDSAVAAAVVRGEVPAPRTVARLRAALGGPDPYVETVSGAVAELLDYVEDRAPGDARRVPAAAGGDAPGSGPVPATGDRGTFERRDTRRWRGVSALALGALAAGLLLESPGLVLSSAVGVGYAAFARRRDVPEPTLSVEHEFGDESPRPGDEVTVTVTVRNEGERSLPDLRLVDGVPEHLPVVDGTPRHGAVLPSGATTTFEYTVSARRGVHGVRPCRVQVRPLSGAALREGAVADDCTLTVRPRPDPSLDAPVRDRLANYVGRRAAGTAGEGSALHSVREYRRGDPANRVDWRRYARTGDLATVAFDEERAATVVLVVDARESAYVASGPRDQSALDRSATLAVTLASTLRDAGHRVGLAALGPRECWLRPTASRAGGDRLQEALVRDPAFSHDPPDGACYAADWVEAFRRRFSSPAQVFVLSPLLDDGSVTVARSLEAYGFPATVVAPDPTVRGTAGERVVALERRLRLASLREAGLRVVDWPAGTGERTPVERLASRWNQ